MRTTLWLLAALAAFDSMLLGLLFWFLRRQPKRDPRNLVIIGAGLSGFVFHALMFFRDGFLILQLATILGIFALYAWLPSKPRGA
jgi:hypothetical protein